MGFEEPGSRQGSTRKAVHVATIAMFISCSTISSALAGQWAGLELMQNSFSLDKLIRDATGWHGTGSRDLNTLVEKAAGALRAGSLATSFQGLFNDGDVQFTPQRAIGDNQSTTVKFAQTYRGLEVVGNEAMVHFDRTGAIHDVTGKALDIALSTEPTLTAADAYRILADRYQQRIKLSERARLKIFRDFDGRAHLVYHLLTRTTPTHAGQEVFLDAHNGTVVLELDRAYDATFKGSRSVYTADTDAAREHVDGRGYPTDIDMSWYKKVIEDGERSENVDRSALNAYRNSGMVYAYYKDNFNRKSYDGQDSRIVSVVHMGVKMNNAFWTTEYKIMAYGDGDDEHLTDLTYGLDVAAHELTHGVTASTARLVYAAESGALNESYSDFFGKMVDYNDDWDIGARIMAPKWKRRALRNMKTPEEFRQPGSNDSPLKIPTAGPCNRANDRCGVHTNSGIPSRAAVLIVEAIGKEKAEQLYYKVLTTRLSATSGFKDARVETEKACALMFDGSDSTECRAVAAAFDTVKM